MLRFLSLLMIYKPRLGKKHYKTVKPVLMERAIIMADVIAIAWNRCNKKHPNSNVMQSIERDSGSNE